MLGFSACIRLAELLELMGGREGPLVPRVVQVYGTRPVGVGEDRHRSAGPQLSGKGHSTTLASEHSGDSRVNSE